MELVRRYDAYSSWVILGCELLWWGVGLPEILGVTLDVLMVGMRSAWYIVWIAYAALWGEI